MLKYLEKMPTLEKEMAELKTEISKVNQGLAQILNNNNIAAPSAAKPSIISQEKGKEKESLSALDQNDVKNEKKELRASSPHIPTLRRSRYVESLPCVVNLSPVVLCTALCTLLLTDFSY